MANTVIGILYKRALDRQWISVESRQTGKKHKERKRGEESNTKERRCRDETDNEIDDSSHNKSRSSGDLKTGLVGQDESTETRVSHAF